MPKKFCRHIIILLGHFLYLYCILVINIRGTLLSFKIHLQALYIYKYPNVKHQIAKKNGFDLDFANENHNCIQKSYINTFISSKVKSHIFEYLLFKNL